MPVTTVDRLGPMQSKQGWRVSKKPAHAPAYSTSLWWTNQSDGLWGVLSGVRRVWGLWRTASECPRAGDPDQEIVRVRSVGTPAPETDASWGQAGCCNSSHAAIQEVAAPCTDVCIPDFHELHRWVPKTTSVTTVVHAPADPTLLCRLQLQSHRAQNI